MHGLCPNHTVKVLLVGNPFLRDRLDARINQALAEARNCAKLDHQGMVGQIRQIVVEDLLKPLLPEGVHVGTGKITDSIGNLSGETDVIIYDRRTIPPLMYDEKKGIFPIEVVYYAIEVKSKLTADELRRSLENGQRLRALKGLQPHSALFAFGSDLVASNDSERFIQAQKDMTAPLPINIFCIASREYGFWNTVWNLLADDGRNTVIISFLVGILNTLVQSAHFRRPSLEPGWYFYPGIEKT